jgi:uncharacterized protein YbgA (DUF1722 family)/uncharacterized protein YbbK (DUF523 family)
MNTPIKIGVSSCLLGNPVRYDGGHQLDPFISDTLGRFFEFVPVCPEAESGLGVPRETMRLVGDPQSPQLLTTTTGIDHTERVLAWARQRVRELEGEGLYGFIFKARSPTSGMERVKVYPAKPGGLPKRVGVGLFARVFMEHFPLLPVEDEGRLHDIGLRENFIERVFVTHRWRRLKSETMTAKGLIAFHSAHKLQIMAHSERHYRAMGPLVARTTAKPMTTLFAEYEALLLAALRLQATVKKHCNVLLHILGYFKKELPAAEKEEMLSIIGHYREGDLPLIVPITLLLHYVRKYRKEYLAQQTYLEPHPLELKLRNHA